MCRSYYAITLKRGSDVYREIPFGKGWNAFGEHRKRVSTLLYGTVLAFFSPAMFADSSIFEIISIEKGTVEQARFAVPDFQNVSSAFAKSTCGPGNKDEGVASVATPLSNGRLSDRSVTFWSCECECLSNEDCDHFIYDPGESNTTLTGYCQLRRPALGLSRFQIMQSLKDRSEHDAREDQTACVWVYTDTAVDAGKVDNAFVWLDPLGALQNVTQQLVELLAMDSTVRDQHYPDAGSQQCHEKGTLIKDIFSPEDLFLSDVCTTLASTANSGACYGRIKDESYDDARYKRLVQPRLDCNIGTMQDVIRNELEVVDCWQMRPFDIALYAANLTIGVAVAAMALYIFNGLDSVFSIGKPEPREIASARRTCFSIFIFVGLLLMFGFLILRSWDVTLQEDGRGWQRLRQIITKDLWTSGEASRSNQNAVQRRMNLLYVIYFLFVMMAGVLMITYLVYFNTQGRGGIDQWDILVRLFRSHAGASLAHSAEHNLKGRYMQEHDLRGKHRTHRSDERIYFSGVQGGSSGYWDLMGKDDDNNDKVALHV